MYPADVDPMSGCRLPLPRREELNDAGQRIYDSLADPKGGTLRGLRGPGGILLHSPELSRYARPLNREIRAGRHPSLTASPDPMVETIAAGRGG
jgi:4-carboxymuconolactone decarboxylase